MKKVFLFVCLCIVLCVPAFAATGTHFYSSPFTVNLQYDDGNGNVTSGSITFTGPSGTSFYLEASTVSANVECISHDPGAGTVSWSGTDQFGAPVSGSSSSWSTRRYTGYANCYTCHCRSVNTTDLNGTYTWFAAPANNDVIVPAYSDFLVNGNPSEPTPPGPSSSFRVPAGNVLYFQVDSEQDIILNANMPKLSSLLGGSKPWGDSGIMYGPAASLPTSTTTFPILSQDYVSWTVKQPTNVLGQSRVGTASKRCIVGQWYALYLPSIFGLLDTTSDLDSSRYLPGASVDISGSFSQIKVYPLESQYNWSGADFVTGSADEYETYYDGSVDENGSVTFTNQDGVVSTPPNGGSNQFDVDTNPLNLVETIKNILSNILKEIESLFTFGYDAIRSLVGIMSDFVSVFQGLYSWLPQPVYSALISAVTIAIVIGVFKVFL